MVRLQLYVIHADNTVKKICWFTEMYLFQIVHYGQTLCNQLIRTETVVVLHSSQKLTCNVFWFCFSISNLSAQLTMSSSCNSLSTSASFLCTLSSSMAVWAAWRSQSFSIVSRYCISTINSDISPWHLFCKAELQRTWCLTICIIFCVRCPNNLWHKEVLYFLL